MNENNLHRINEKNNFFVTTQYTNLLPYLKHKPKKSNIKSNFIKKIQVNDFRSYLKLVQQGRHSEAPANIYHISGIFCVPQNLRK